MTSFGVRLIQGGCLSVRLECGHSWAGRLPRDDLVSRQVQPAPAGAHGIPGARVGDWIQWSQWPLRHGHPSLPCGYPPPAQPIIRILAHTPHPPALLGTPRYLWQFLLRFRPYHLMHTAHSPVLLSNFGIIRVHHTKRGLLGQLGLKITNNKKVDFAPSWGLLTMVIIFM